MSIMKQVEALGDDELALVINKFKRFHDNYKNHWCGAQKEVCFSFGDPNHFIANYPEMKGKYDSGKWRTNTSTYLASIGPRRRMSKACLRRSTSRTPRLKSVSSLLPLVTSSLTQAIATLPLAKTCPSARPRASSIRSASSLTLPRMFLRHVT